MTGVRTVKKRRRTLRYWLRHQEQKCVCGGYHFPHRRGGGACDSSPRQAIYIALRGGNPAEVAQARFEYAQLRVAVAAAGAECPF